MNELASIYGLKDRRNDEVFYVGMSTDSYARYGEHTSIRSAKTDKDTRILDMRKDGLLPELIVIEKNLSRSKALEREAHWIRYYRSLGAPLTNSTQLKRESTGTHSIEAICEKIKSGIALTRAEKNHELVKEEAAVLLSVIAGRTITPKYVHELTRKDKGSRLIPYRAVSYTLFFRVSDLLALKFNRMAEK